MDKQITLAVIGDPVYQSPSPEMFAAAIKDLGLNATYEKILVKEHELKSFIEKIRSGEIDGCNVTIPHKETVIEFLDAVTPIAKKAGAVNTVFRKDDKVIGHNTDAIGFASALVYTYDIDAKKTKALIFGEGGAARAIVCGLADKGFKAFAILGRDFKWAEDLFGDRNLVINATPLGMVGYEDWQDLGFLDKISKQAIVCDVVANPIETSFLKRARALGHPVLPGHLMLLHQGVEAFDIFFGQMPNVEVMRDALLTALTRPGLLH